MKTCIACGMPLRKKSEYPLGDTSKDYCIYCAHPDGTMHTFEEKKKGMVSFITKTQGLSPEVAEKAALEAMKKLPAWKGQF